MSASVSVRRRGLPLAAGVIAYSLSATAMAQQAPGWLNWGGGSEPESTNESSEERPAVRTTPATTMPMSGDAGSVTQSGQAALLQRLMQRVNDLERQMQAVRGQLSEQERKLQRQSERVDEAMEAAQSQPAAGAGGMMPAQGGQASMGSPSAPTGPGAPSAPQAPAASGGNGAAAASGGSAPSAGGAGASDEEQQALYNEAFEVLKSGDYDAAIQAFQKVIDANPQGSWAPSAYFWQGETYYVKQDYDAARQSYTSLVQRFPDSRRVPDAKLKMGYIAQEKGDSETARQLFSEVVSDHPDSQAAGLAKQRLSRMGGG
ncbi:tol-pal system protein YbgF [Guyparkeria hydrothermalis]|uniref:tol-pal system protein YbgF n=1 Tax=Guyparkeria hydrothermalis TaxID=923 RepID=UPI0020201D55|nr:tol-pal system protein YbgF [Guyparkeria hydrothermalis]MCL7744757.1 tol-pal system protein YbgF [Guyparkeria hydrothermalis]